MMCTMFIINVSQFIIALAWVMIISTLKIVTVPVGVHTCFLQHTTGAKDSGPYYACSIKLCVNYICTVQSTTIDLQSWKKDCHGIRENCIPGLYTIHGYLQCYKHASNVTSYVTFSRTLSLHT